MTAYSVSRDDKEIARSLVAGFSDCSYSYTQFIYLFL